jgi:FtsZ-binding cell division protein ZapB
MTTGQVIVLGMHRSGTSAIIKLLEKLGCYLGEPDEFLPGNDANPKGYWERLDIVNLNKKLLESQQQDWISINEFRLTDVPPQLSSELKEEAAQIIHRLDEHDPWAIKDPRLSVLLPFWRPLLKRPMYLLCVRNPVEVAMSLAKRNALPLSVGYALWELYSRSMWTVTTGSTRLIVNYHELLKHPLKEADRLSRWLRDGGLTRVRNVSEKDVRDVVDASLHRQRSRPGDMSALPETQGRLFALLKNGTAMKNGLTEISVMSKDLLTLHSRTRSLSSQLKHQVSAYQDNIAQKNLQLEQMSEDKKMLEGRIAESKTAISTQSSAYRDNIAQKNLQLEQMSEDKKMLEGRVTELKTALSTQSSTYQDDITRKNLQLKELEQSNKLLENNIMEINSGLRAQEERVRELESSLNELRGSVREREEMIEKLGGQLRNASERIELLQLDAGKLREMIQTRDMTLQAAREELDQRIQIIKYVDAELTDFRLAVDKLLGPAIFGRRRMVELLERLLKRTEKSNQL